MRPAFPVKSLSCFLGVIQSDVAQSGVLLNRMERALYATPRTYTHCHFDRREKSAFVLPGEKQISPFGRNDSFWGDQTPALVSIKGRK